MASLSENCKDGICRCDQQFVFRHEQRGASTALSTEGEVPCVALSRWEVQYLDQCLGLGPTENSEIKAGASFSVMLTWLGLGAAAGAVWGFVFAGEIRLAAGMYASLVVGFVLGWFVFRDG